MVRLALSPNICELSTSEHVVGARVTNREAFLAIMMPYVTEAIAMSEVDDGHGRCGVELLSDVLPFVSSGIGPRSEKAEDYVTRPEQRGRFLKRELALPPETVTVFALTKERYLTDYLLYDSERLSDTDLDGVTHVVMTIEVKSRPERGYYVPKPKPEEMRRDYALVCD